MDSRRTRILCANCNICVNTLRRYRILDQNTKVCSVLCNWIYPRIVTENDCVCEACWELAMASVSRQSESGNEPQAESRQRGHINVCIMCGLSLVRRQSDKVLKDNPSEMQLQMIDIIKQHKEPLQVTSSDKVCHVCWLRTKREALRINRVTVIKMEDDQHEYDTTSHENPPHDPLETERPLEDNQPCGDPDEQDTLARPSHTQDTKSGTLILPDYRRAANTGNHCLFPDCTTAGTLHSISDKLRSIILSNHKYYVPKLTRVCGMHALSNSWDTLYESDNSVNVFNAEHVQHIFSFVNAFNPILD